MKRNLRAMLLVAGVALMVSKPCALAHTDVTAQQARELIESTSDLTVVDVREPHEYCGAKGHIPGAVNIPFDQVAQRIAELDAPHGVALYCMVGPRARKGESALREVGYEKVFHLEGGLAAWQAAGLPVEGGR